MKRVKIVTMLMLAVMLCVGQWSVVTAAASLSKLVLSKNELVLEIGETAVLTATGVYSDGTTSNVTIHTDWSSDDAAVASVYNGTITAKSVGTATVMAIYQGLPQSVQVKVTKKVKALTKNKQSIDLRTAGTETIALTATYSDNTTEDVSDQAEWTSSDEQTAVVVNGVVKGEKPGTATITAKFGKQTVSVEVNVELVKRLEADQKELFMLLNETEKIKLTATYPDGSTKDVTADAVWTTSNDKVADAIKGEVKTYGQGQATITAAYGTKVAQILIDVDKTSKLDISENSLFLRLNESKQLQLTAIFPDGRTSNITQSAKWSSDNEEVANVHKGLIRANKSGTATISAQYGNKTVQIPVDVETVRFLDISEKSVVLKANESKKLTVTATYINGVKEEISGKAAWTSTDEEAVFVAKGEITGYAMGQATVSASYGGKTAKTSVDVDVPQKLSVASNKVSVKLNEPTLINLIAVYADGREEVVTETAAWSTSNDQTVTVDKGTVTGLVTGKANITAEYGKKKLVITVESGYASELTADVKVISLGSGETKQIVLTASDGFGNTQDVTSDAAWTSSNEAVAGVNKGLVTAYTSGKANITAKHGLMTVTIPAEVDVIQKIEASVPALSMKSGEQANIVITVTLANGSKKDVTAVSEWTTSNYKVAAVSQGQIKAAGYGKANITATYGGKSIRIPVEVDILKYLQTDVVNLELKVGQQATVKAEATYFDGAVRNVSVDGLWTTSNIMVATVKDGVIKANGKGKATITVSYGDKKTKIAVNVK